MGLAQERDAGVVAALDDLFGQHHDLLQGLVDITRGDQLPSDSCERPSELMLLLVGHTPVSPILCLSTREQVLLGHHHYGWTSGLAIVGTVPARAQAARA